VKWDRVSFVDGFLETLEGWTLPLPLSSSCTVEREMGWCEETC